MSILAADQCPNCGCDMMYDPCPGIPRGEGTPPAMVRGEVAHCDICDQICCSDVDCRQMCQSNYCRMLLCNSCALKGGEWIFCPPHLRAWREEEARRIEGELEDLSCRAEEVFGKGSPEMNAIEQARNVLRQSAGRMEK